VLFEILTETKKRIKQMIYYLKKGESLNKYFNKNKKFSHKDEPIKMNVKLGGDFYGKLQKKDMNIIVKFTKA
tara:strand:+ start:279 stop:494 length:216 start_codon:yes stop_codon:yes gene_type:complete